VGKLEAKMAQRMQQHSPVLHSSFPDQASFTSWLLQLPAFKRALLLVVLGCPLNSEGVYPKALPNAVHIEFSQMLVTKESSKQQRRKALYDACGLHVVPSHPHADELRRLILACMR